MIEGFNLQTIEAVLTGESKPSNKKTEILPKDTILADRENMVYQGTSVSQGKGKAVIVATGFKTEFGRIASLIKETEEEKTPLQKSCSCGWYTRRFSHCYYCLFSHWYAKDFKKESFGKKIGGSGNSRFGNSHCLQAL